MKKKKSRSWIDRMALAGSAGLIVLAGASFINVNAHNLSDGKYANWNIFTMRQSVSQASAIPEEKTAGDYQAEKAEAKKAKGERQLEEVKRYQEESQEKTELKYVKARTARKDRIKQVKKMSNLQDEYIDIAFEVGEQNNICPELIVALMERESGGDPNAKNSCGDTGLTQINPRWHEERIKRLGVTDLTDPEGNIEVCVDYLSELFEKHEDACTVLMNYNMGGKGAEIAEEGTISEYADVILTRSRELEGAFYD